MSRIIKLALVFCSLGSTVVIGRETQSEDEKALLQSYGDEEILSIATGSKQAIAKAPAVATVITAKDIKAIGATDLDEILETVPGLHIGRNPSGYDPVYTIRGIYSNYNSQVLFLLNGIPLTNLFLGDRNGIWGGMPVQSIERIEVIRGPGSAVYGADASAGVINIITKTNKGINGTEIGGRVGSFNTYDGWTLHGSTWNGFDVAATLEYRTTDGQRKTIQSDAQTLNDSLGGTHASLAPGPVNLQRDNLDVRLDISKDNWRFRGGLQHRSNFGTGVGVAQALDPHGRYGSDRWNADLTYHDADLVEDWDITAQLSYFNTSQIVEKNSLLYPPGSFAGFPNGVIGNPEVFERHGRANISASYSGLDRHTVRVGTGFNYSSIYDVRESKNYRLEPNQPPLPLDPGNVGNANDVRNVSNTGDAFLSPGSRRDYFAFLQDEWKFAKDWELTTGVRYDYYSDFGSTVNPRLALVWETRHDLTSKFLYGRAFRAPAWAETHNMNNPVAVGNQNLKPETINTIELAFDYRPDDKLRFGFNVFNYWWSDIIRFTPDNNGNTRTAKNAGQQTGYGLELEADWRVSSTFNLLGNYSYQESTDESTHHDAGYAPHHRVYLRGDWEFYPNWHLNPQLDWVIDRQRPAGDFRPAVPDYVWADLTLRRKYLLDHWEVAFSVRNLFNSDAREPSPAGTITQQALIPNDLPLPGRYFYGEIRFNF